MNIPKIVREYLRRKGGRYKARAVPAIGDMMQCVTAAGLPPKQVAQATVAIHGTAPLMVIHPVGYKPDLDALQRFFNHPFHLATDLEIERLFPDCSPSALPPLPEAFGIEAVVDTRMTRAGEIFFSPGCPGLLVRITKEEFADMTPGAWSGPVAKPAAASVARQQAHTAQAYARVRASKPLPPMPRVSKEIFKLRSNPYANVSELAAVLEQDPYLTAQVVRYASLPFFGHTGKVDSVGAAMTRVLGMDFVMDLAFGFSVTKSFCATLQNPSMLKAFWQHAIYTGVLTQALSLRVPYLRRPTAGSAYLSGLLHNFGILLLEYLFPEQAVRMKAGLQKQPDRSSVELEHQLLGLAHTDVGLWLMEDWGMSQEIAESAHEHHNPGFRGKHSACPNLVYIANALLKRYGIGDANSVSVPGGMLSAVGLDARETEAALGVVLANRQSLDFIVHTMAA